MKVCKHCGEINTNDSSFCCNCGQSNFIVQEEIACPHCGALNDKSFAHCINCGNKLTGANVALRESEGYVPAPVDVKDGMSGVFDTGLSSAPSETARCTHCGALVPITAIFCHKCGLSVASLHSHRVVKRKVCPHCGSLNKLEVNLCSYCFHTLDSCDTEDLQVTHESQNLGELIVRQAYLEGVGGKKLICSNCGTLNDAKEPFCAHCGLKLEIEDLKKYCPNCGAENSIDSAFCSKCRWSFEGEDPNRIEKWTCSHCDHVNDKEDLFCPNCGQKKV